MPWAARKAIKASAALLIGCGSGIRGRERSCARASGPPGGRVGRREPADVGSISVEPEAADGNVERGMGPAQEGRDVLRYGRDPGRPFGRRREIGAGLLQE